MVTVKLSCLKALTRSNAESARRQSPARANFASAFTTTSRPASAYGSGRSSTP